jgi:RNA polymerase sigma factor (TIGR02999 family)
MSHNGETTPGVEQKLYDGREPDRDAVDRQVPLLYEQLKRVAARHLRNERSGHTLNPTALVHEAYLKLADQQRIEPRNQDQFLALTARMMRRVLVDYARRRKAGKRGGRWLRTTLSGEPASAQSDPAELLALDAAIEQLDSRQRQVVELRFFTGLTEQEIGNVLGISARTVRREWVKARAWLYSELYPEG